MSAYIHPDLSLLVASIVALFIYARLYWVMDNPGPRFHVSFGGLVIIAVACFLNWFEETPHEHFMLAFTDEEGWDFILPVFFFAPGGLMMCWGFTEWTRLALSLKKEVAQREETERKLRSALSVATEANTMRTLVLDAVNQELRMPLDELVGFSEILRLQQRKQDENTTENYYAQIIKKSSEHLLGITDDLVALARFRERQQSTAVWREASLKDLLAGVVMDFKASHPQRSVAFTSNTYKSMWLNAPQVEYVFRRLLQEINRIARKTSTIHVSAAEDNTGKLFLLFGVEAVQTNPDLMRFCPDQIGKPLTSLDMSNALGLTRVLTVLSDYVISQHAGNLEWIVVSDRKWQARIGFEPLGANKNT